MQALICTRESQVSEVNSIRPESQPNLNPLKGRKQNSIDMKEIIFHTNDLSEPHEALQEI